MQLINYLTPSCQGDGHDFTWGSATTKEGNPPSDMLCECGQMEWIAERREYRLRYHLSERMEDE